MLTYLEGEELQNGTGLRLNGLLVAIIVLLGGQPASAQAAVRYQLTLDATWSQTTHPVEFPPDPHFSPLIGAVHTAEANLWEVGALASPGIEWMAEEGGFDVLTTEIDALAMQGLASPTRILVAGLCSPGVRQISFTAQGEFDHVSVVTMVAPSPDWFIGVDRLPLFQDGLWRDNIQIDLYPYDAGTDDGVTFEGPDADSMPPQPISRILDAPLGDGTQVVPLGTYTFTVLNVNGLSPYVDSDSDGLHNLLEASLGTNPQLADTDGDQVGDAQDNCALVSNPTQADDDGDGAGNTCDNCPIRSNAQQQDLDSDGEGDVCDLNDGAIRFENLSASSVEWQDEPAYTEFHLYRGDLSRLRLTGEYSQQPDGALADRFCGIGAATTSDAYVPPPGETAFYLVSGDNAGVESGLGEDGNGNPRPHDHPCTP